MEREATALYGSPEVLRSINSKWVRDLEERRTMMMEKRLN
jgi:hypothetical protein